jgi:hypothetical protein
MEVMDNEKFIAIEFTDVGLGCLMTISLVETVCKLLFERILRACLGLRLRNKAFKSKKLFWQKLHF